MPETQITDHDALFSELSLKIEALETQRNYLLADIRKAIAGLWDVVERASFRGPTAEQVEGAPEGPYEISQHSDGRQWIVLPKQLVDKVYVKWRFTGTKAEAIAVRDVLNGLEYKENVERGGAAVRAALVDDALNRDVRDKKGDEKQWRRE